ncbi:MAG: hypothetical protein DWQ36_24650 [Acidobacteria bacterium]|nr:MAG: hypothetical protein DWQ30_16960 [Acidobacteriota bacterium]REJ99649.1 MAG: hypothetical protein DWQ36_24650 [Acidobacteriota bacterium]
MNSALRVLSALSLTAAVGAGPSLAQTRTLGERTFTRDSGGWLQHDPDGRSFEVLPDVITILPAPGVEDAALEALHRTHGVEVLRVASTGFIDLRLQPGTDPFDALDAYTSSGMVRVAEPTTRGEYVGFAAIPDDTGYGGQWHLPRIDAETAWDSTTGSPAVVVAILDSGTEFTHSDLGLGGDVYQNVWLNPGEDAWSDPDDPSTGNGIDDDLNGYIDDWKGFDFSDGDNNSAGSFFHGTAVAGVVGAKTHNNLGHAGVAGGWNGPGAQLMIAGVGDLAPNGSVIDDAILYAAENGARIVQLSLTVGFSAAIEAAVEMAHDTYGLVIVCASGNDTSTSVGFPSSLARVIAVGATDSSDFKASFSNHGSGLDVSAPGVSLPVLNLGNGYTNSSGTSFAAPIVSGIVALMFSLDPGLANVDARQILRDTADKVGGYNYMWNGSMPGHSFEIGYGRVNAAAALQALGLFADGFESGDVSAWSSSTP